MGKYLKHPLFIIGASILAVIVGWVMKAPILDTIVSVLGMVHVWLLMKEKMLNFIFGIIAFGSYVYIYVSSELYAMAVVAFVQTMFLIYGWFFWNKHRQGDEVPRTNRFTRKQLQFWILGMLVAWFLWGLLEKNVFGGSLPFLNSLTAVIGLVAEYWLSRKYLENWHLFILSDALAVCTVLLSGLYPMAILYGINTLLSVQGLREWKANDHSKSIKEINVV